VLPGADRHRFSVNVGLSLKSSHSMTTIHRSHRPIALLDG
jgi:hypothetical protein